MVLYSAVSKSNLIYVPLFWLCVKLFLLLLQNLELWSESWSWFYILLLCWVRFYPTVQQKLLIDNSAMQISWAAKRKVQKVIHMVNWPMIYWVFYYWCNDWLRSVWKKLANESKKDWHPIVGLAPVWANFISTALWVKAHWECSVEILELLLSFYLCSNISDRFFNLTPHFIRIQIFQIYLKETKWTFFIFHFSICNAFVKQLRKKKGRVEAF